MASGSLQFTSFTYATCWDTKHKETLQRNINHNVVHKQKILQLKSKRLQISRKSIFPAQHYSNGLG